MRFLEKHISNEQTLKRLKRFNARSSAVWSLYALIFMIVVSVFSEVASNSRPIIMGHDNGLYMPVFNDYHPSELLDPDR
jgi:microcin C transport system permease protein